MASERMDTKRLKEIEEILKEQVEMKSCTDCTTVLHNPACKRCAEGKGRGRGALAWTPSPVIVAMRELIAEVKRRHQEAPLP